MKIRRYVAKDMRGALAQIKEELGADAVILSNKKIAEGVELMAAVDYNDIVPTAKVATLTKEHAEINTRAADTFIDNPQITAAMEREMANDIVSLASKNTAGVASITNNTVNNNPLTDEQGLSALLNRFKINNI